MVMRQRTGTPTTGRPTTGRPTTGRPATGRQLPQSSQNYQYLTPTFEWKQAEEGCAVLVVHLPGFAKEQLVVQLQSMDKLRVRGTRQARGNTFIRFDQTYPIPEDCTTTGLQAKFEAGLLYVTFQRKKEEERADDVTPPAASIAKQSKPTQLPPPKKPMEEAIDSTAPPPKPSSSISPGDGKPVEAPSKVMESQESVSYATEAKKTAEAPPTEAGLEKEKDPRTTTEEALISNKPEEAEKVGEDTVEKAEKVGEDTVEKAEKVGEDTVEKATAGEEMGEMEKALLDQKQAEIEEKKMSEEPKAMDGSSDQIKMDKESNLRDEINETDQERLEEEKIDESAANIMEQKGTKIGSSTAKNGIVDKEYDQFGKYKQIVKGFITPKDEEERKLLVNIGVAALVIVALGVYITYSRWSSAKRQ